ncbi:MAG TPA: DEAD/DEAH box helicase [Stellaceae bacterium]|nr:DEAD/DEAH box helicase [Stellaceae bacterium]
MSFADFNLHPLLLQALETAGYTEPTPIQAAALPLAIAGRDLIGTAQTGTGKTAAFVLPALQRIAATLDDKSGRPRQRGPHILVLAPTRELAGQIVDAVRVLGKFMRLNTVSILGGMPYRLQMQQLSRPVDIIVATPGRLIDHLTRRTIDLSQLQLLVLDEADRMLDMGFIDDVERIAAASPSTRQTLLFTATFDRRMTELANRLLTEPERIAVDVGNVTVDRIEQRLQIADDLGHKRRLLAHWAASEEVGKAIIFAATNRDADQLAAELTAAGHNAAPLHGDMTQGARNHTVMRLRNGHIRLLVATDVAARGIDVKDITHVINFDLPRQAEDYVHRIGRTGRAGATGIAISFASPADKGLVDRIERYTGAPLVPHVVTGLEPQSGFHSRPKRRFGRPGEGGSWNKSGGPRPASAQPYGARSTGGHTGDAARRSLRRVG